MYWHKLLANKFTNSKSLKKRIHTQLSHYLYSQYWCIHNVQRYHPNDKKIGPIKGFEQTFLSNKREKWILVMTKSMKLRVQASFDDILKQCSIPMTRNNHQGRVSKTNNNTDMMSYIPMLTKDSTPYDFNKHLQWKSSIQRKFTVSYDINASNEFPNINNNKKTKRKFKEREHDNQSVKLSICWQHTLLQMLITSQLY